MAVFPQAPVLFNTDPNWTAAQARVEFERWLASTLQLPGAAEAEALTIATGKITPTRAAVIVDTEGGTSADDLTTIATTNMHAGAVLMLCAANSGRTVKVKHGTGAGGIALLGGVDCALSTTHWLMLRRVGDAWAEMPPLRAAQAQQAADMAAGHVLAGKTTAEAVRSAIGAPSPNVGKYMGSYRLGAGVQALAAATWTDISGGTPVLYGDLGATDPGTGVLALRVPESGTYMIQVGVMVNASLRGEALAGISKNGKLVSQQGNTLVGDGWWVQAKYSAPEHLEANDVVGAMVRCSVAADIPPSDSFINLVRVR